jgi:recombination protein RecA
VLNNDARAVVAKLNKDFGQGSIIPASDQYIAKRFTTGSLAFDTVLGGGWPANHWVEIYGIESHGKTFVTLKTIAANQKVDPNFATFWVAAEHFDKDQAQALGVDLERVMVYPTQEMENAFEAILAAAASHAYDCVVLDSYPALIASEEAEKDMDQAVMAIGARLVGKFFRKVGNAMRRNEGERPILGIFINQIRVDVGGWAPRGVPVTTPGGKAKNYAFYVRVEVKRDDWLLEKRPRRGDVKVGQVIKVDIKKNKSAAPQQVATISAYFRDAPTQGFKRGDYDILKETIVYGIAFKVIEQRGKWLRYAGHQWGSKNEAIEAFREMPSLVDDIYKEVIEILDSGRVDEIETMSDSKEE